MVILKEFKLAQGISAEGSGRGEGGRLEGFNVLMRVAVYHSVYQRVLAIFNLDVFCWLEFAAWEMNVEGDIIGPLVQREAQQDLRSWSIIFPRSPLVSLLPFVGCPSSTICS